MTLEIVCSYKMTLEMQVHKTPVGPYIVTHIFEEAPLDIQESAFAVYGVEIVSPAQLGFLRTDKGQPSIFCTKSRTSADVLYDDRNNRVVIVPDRAISKIVDTANLVNAHRQQKVYVIPDNQREKVYAMADEMLGNVTAFTANHGRTDLNTSEFEQTELTSKLFSDENLGIKAQNLGDWLLQERLEKTIPIFFDDIDYAKSQKGPYLDRLEIFGPAWGFGVHGNTSFSLHKGDYRKRGHFGAFGVRFEKTAESGTKKS